MDQGIFQEKGGANAGGGGGAFPGPAGGVPKAPEKGGMAETKDPNYCVNFEL